MPDGFRVTVEDLATGNRQSKIIQAGDYILIPFAPCYLARTQADLANGTHVLTIKGRRPTAPTAIEETPDRWVLIDGVGGYVCAHPDPTRPDGICGMPVEDEPCPTHTIHTTTEETPDAR